MIISASRRTDIPAYYSEWLINRMREGFVYVKNPMNPNQVSRIDLSYEVIDGIVFWTKNPLPMMKYIDIFKSIPYYFQFTLTSYSNDIETGLPSKNTVLIPTFIELSNTIGADRVIWRYDPIVLSEKYTVEYHIRYFEKMARRLSGYAKRCTISFLDIYRNTEKNMRHLGIKAISQEDMHMIARTFSDIASANNISLSTCTEKIDLAEYGIKHAKCIDPEIFEQITGNKYRHIKDRNQRSECGCAPSIDIGAYNSCLNGCLYCYANYNKSAVPSNNAMHDPASPIIIGKVTPEAKITDRQIASALEYL